MSTKAQNLADPNSCWNKAADDEPVFVLRAKDPAAPGVVRHWVDITRDLHDNTKRQLATGVASQMEAWRIANPPKPKINVASLDHAAIRDQFSDVISDLVATGEALGYSLKIAPQTASTLGMANVPPQMLVHVAHVERDPADPVALTAPQLAEHVRSMQNTLQALLALVPGAIE